jgi:hypothetical protein
MEGFHDFATAGDDTLQAHAGVDYQLAQVLVHIVRTQAPRQAFTEPAHIFNSTTA